MSPDYKLLCVSTNGKRIVFDPMHSHTATHFSDNPTLPTLAKELLSGMSLEDNLIAKDIDIGRPIGNSDVVETDDKDDIIYAMRKNREDQGYVPFTKSQSPQRSSFISIYLVKKDTETYELASTWIGRYESPPFPQMENATHQSVPYWSKHAFAWGSQEIIPDSVLVTCPW